MEGIVLDDGESEVDEQEANDEVEVEEVKIEDWVAVGDGLEFRAQSDRESSVSE